MHTAKGTTPPLPSASAGAAAHKRTAGPLGSRALLLSHIQLCQPESTVPFLWDCSPQSVHTAGAVLPHLRNLAPTLLKIHTVGIADPANLTWSFHKDPLKIKQFNSSS